MSTPIPAVDTRLLTLDDIADTRAYEREREAFRSEVIALKALRRVHIGPVITVVFENRTTIRFQVQEMARAERIMTDEGIQHELDTYNPLISRAGRLTATLFIECTTEEEMREWFPKLVGIERSLELRVGEGGAALVVRCAPEAQHETQLTREEMTAAVHYVHFEVGAAHAQRLADGPAALAVVHPQYQADTPLGEVLRVSLAADLA